MANSKAAKKRIHINKRNQLQNKYYKTSFRTLKKLFLKNLELYKISKNLKDKQNLRKILSSIYSIIDKGTKKNIFHNNTAARNKAKLATFLNKV